MNKHIKKSNPFALLVALLLLCPAVNSVFAEDYGLYYFKERVPLKLDSSQVAVLSTNNAEQDLDALGRLGVSTTKLTTHAIRGWKLVGTDDPINKRPQLSETLDQIGNDGQFDFAAPVFFDSYGGPFFPTRDILVRFNADIDKEERDQILADANLGTIVQENWANMQGAYLIRSNSLNGLVVMEQANTLAQMPAVRWAEPDMVFTGVSGTTFSGPGLLRTIPFSQTAGDCITSVNRAPAKVPLELRIWIWMPSKRGILPTAIQISWS